MSFLPTNYEVPNDSNYMKLEKGQNKFRILSSAIVGMEYWKTVDGKRRPVRKHMNEPIPAADIELNVKTGEPEKVKHFWAFVVWNYKAQKIQILELTQKSIMNQIKEYTENEDWGDPKEYDLTITKKGEGFDTEYTAIASPHKVASKESKDLYKATPIRLEALFEGKDPFSTELLTDAETQQAVDDFQAIVDGGK